MTFISNRVKNSNVRSNKNQIYDNEKKKTNLFKKAAGRSMGLSGPAPNITTFQTTKAILNNKREK